MDCLSYLYSSVHLWLRSRAAGLLALVRNEFARFCVRLFDALVGTLLVASGTGTLNQYMERSSDCAMRRTAQRPLPSGRMNPAAALWWQQNTHRVPLSHEPFLREELGHVA